MSELGRYVFTMTMVVTLSNGITQTSLPNPSADTKVYQHRAQISRSSMLSRLTRKLEPTHHYSTKLSHAILACVPMKGRLGVKCLTRPRTIAPLDQ